MDEDARDAVSLVELLEWESRRLFRTLIIRDYRTQPIPLIGLKPAWWNWYLAHAAVQIQVKSVDLGADAHWVVPFCCLDLGPTETIRQG